MLRIQRLFKTLSPQTVRPAITTTRCISGFGNTGPAPPKLDKKDQEEFERLQRKANTQAALEMTPEELEQFAKDLEQGKSEAEAKLAVHPEYRKPYKDFEGNKNPETGEVGGPKQDPLRHGDYSFNGRVTDF